MSVCMKNQLNGKIRGMGDLLPCFWLHHKKKIIYQKNKERGLNLHLSGNFSTMNTLLITKIQFQFSNRVCNMRRIGFKGRFEGGLARTDRQFPATRHSYLIFFFTFVPSVLWNRPTKLHHSARA